ncbi:outer membrane autotransporter protein [Amorphus suaedae]
MAQATQPGADYTVNVTAGPTSNNIVVGSDLVLPGEATGIDLNFLAPTSNLSDAARVSVESGAQFTIQDGANVTFEGNGRFNFGTGGAVGSGLMTGGSLTLGNSGTYSTFNIGFGVTGTGSQSGSGTYTQNAGHVQLNGSALQIGVQDALGRYSMNGGSVNLTRGSTIYVGEYTHGDGVLQISGNSQFTTEDVASGSGTQIFIGQNGGVGTILQDGQGSLVDIDSGANAFWFGSTDGGPVGGHGTYDLRAGQFKVQGTNGIIFGQGSGTTGDFLQSGGEFTANTRVVIGGAGTGTYNLSGGTSTMNNGLVVASAGGSTGTVNQTGGALTVVGGLSLGSNTGVATYNLNGGTFTVDGITGNASSGLTFGGGTLIASQSFATSSAFATNFAATSGITVNGSDTVTWNSAITGAGGLTKTGTGTLALTTDNSTYTGAVSLQGGTLALEAANALNGNSLATAAGTTLDITGLATGATVAIGGLSGGATINLGDSDLVVSIASGQQQAFTGTINSDQWGYESNPGTFHKIGAGDLLINGSTMNKGESFIVAGSMTQSAGSTAWSNINVGSGAGADGTLFVSGGDLTLNVGMRVGDFGGTGVVNQTGGTVTLQQTCDDNDRCASLNVGNQGGTGTYSISGGSLVLAGGSHTIGRSTGSRDASTGTLNISGTGLVEVRPDDSRGFMVIGDRDNSTNNSTGVINQTGGTLRIVDNSELYLGGYGSGTYNLNGGVLEIGSDNLLGLYGGGNTTGRYDFNLGGGTIRVIGSDLVTAVDAELTGSSTSTIDTNGLNATWKGTLTGTGNLAKAGVGTLILPTANSFTGGVFLQGGTLSLETSTALNGNALTTSGGTVFDISSLSGATVNIGSLSGGGTVSLGNNELVSTIASGQMPAFSGTISSGGAGTFVKAGAGTLEIGGSTLSNSQAFVTAGGLSQGSGTSTWSTLNLGRGSGTAGTLSVSGGSLTVTNALSVGASGGSGIIQQTGGTLALASGSALTLGGTGTGTYNLLGGTLAAGGSSLNGSTGRYAFNLGGGTLQVAGSDLNTSVNGTLNDGTASTIDTNGLNASWGGTLSGSGALRKSGAGTLSLLNANSYTGGTYLNGGTLSAVQGAVGTGKLVFESSSTYAFASGFTLANDATFNEGAIGSFSVAQNDTATLSGQLSGAGGLAKVGLGELLLTGVNNSYTGPTQVNQGRLVATTAGAVSDVSPVSVANGAVFELRGVAEQIESLDGDGEVVLGEGTQLSVIGTNNSTFAGSITGTGGLNKGGSSSLTLTGINTYSGPTAIDGGTLSVVGEITNSDVAVNAGGTLKGTGRVKSFVVNAGGTAAPGLSPGTLTVTTNLTFRPGSTYVAEIENGVSDNIIVQSGVATIEDGANLSLQLTGAPTLEQSYTILQAQSGSIVWNDGFTVTSNFSRPLIENAVQYSPSAVTVTYAGLAAPWSTVVRGTNAGAAANGVQSLGLGNPVYNAAVFLEDEGRIDRAFSLLSGEINASAKSVLVGDSRFVRNAVFDRLVMASGGAGASGMTTAPLGYASNGDGVAPTADPMGTVWAEGFGSWGSTDGDSNVSSLDRNSSGVFIGADKLVSAWRLGVFGGFSHTNFDVDNLSSSGDGDSYHAGLYAGTNWQNVLFRGGAAYSWSDLSTTRWASLPTSQTLSADYSAGTGQIFGEVGYDVQAGQVGFQPFAGLAYVNLHTDSFTETGGAAALTSASDSTSVSYTTLGVRASADFVLGTLLARADGMVGWRHAFGDVTPETSYTFAAGGAPFTVEGVPIGENAFLLDLGLSAWAHNGVSVGVAYSGEFASDASDQSVSGNVSWTF